jgi:hypothetical protein
MRREKSKAVVFAILALGAIAFATSCKNPGSSDLPVKTIEFAPDGAGFIQFYTNDSAKLNYGWYQSYSSATTGGASWDLSVTIRKDSGAIGYGAGCIFGYSDSNNFYRVLLAWNGGYRVDKKVAGTYSPLLDWTQTTAIATGLGQTNVVDVTYTSGSSCSILINGTSVSSFNDTDLSSTGLAGFYASVGSSSYESFPNTPVDVRFKMTSPLAIP